MMMVYFVGFDVAIGNPPYISIQDIDNEQANYLKINYKSNKGNFDLYILFIEKGLEILNKKGFLSFINPNKIFNTDNANLLRNKLSNEKLLRLIVDFEHDLVFEDVGVYTCIILLSTNSNNSEYIEYIKPKNKKIYESSKLLIKYNNLNEKYWIFNDESETEPIQEKYLTTQFLWERYLVIFQENQVLDLIKFILLKLKKGNIMIMMEM